MSATLHIKNSSWLPWSSEYKAVATEVARLKLEQGESVFVKESSEHLPAPVRSARDLEEAESFEKGEAVDDKAEAIMNLARNGWMFQARQGESSGTVGPYAVYNAFTENDFPLQVTVENSAMGHRFATSEVTLARVLELDSQGPTPAQVVRGLRGSNAWKEAAAQGKSLLQQRRDEGARVALEIEGLRHLGSRVYLYEETLEHLDGGLGEVGAAASKAVRAGGYENSWADAKVVSKAFVKALPETPATRAALKAELNHVGSSTRTFEAVLEDPEGDPGNVGARISEELRKTGYDKAWSDARAAGRAFVEERFEQTPNLALEAALQAGELNHVGSSTRFYEAVLKAPAQLSLDQAGRLGQGISVELRGTGYDKAWGDAAKAGRVLCEALGRAGSIPAKAALRATGLNHWGSQTRLYEAVMVEAEQGLLGLGLIGARVSRSLRGSTYKKAWTDANIAGKAFLQELLVQGMWTSPVKLALEMEGLRHPGSYTRLYEGVLEGFGAQSTSELASLASRVVKEVGASGYDHAQRDAARVGQAFFRMLAEKATFAPQFSQPRTASDYRESFESLVTQGLMEPVPDSGEVEFEENYVIVNGVPVPVKD